MRYRLKIPEIVVEVEPLDGSPDPPPPPPPEPEPPKPGSAVHDLLHAKASVIYSGDGRWEKGFAHRNMLRDSAGKADTYVEHLPSIASAIGDYLARVQGSNGVFPIPADEGHPEFGAKIAQALQLCPTCEVNDWIVDLPSPHLHELYYDHGSALYAIAHVARKLGRSDLLPAVRRGADWALLALQRQVSNNTNYNSFLALGLSEAYRATQDGRYRDSAVQIQTQYVVPLQHADGRFGNAHNRELVYHGIITMSLINTATIAPTGLALAVEKAVGAMRAVGMSEDCRALDSGWLGTNRRAWHMLRELRSLSAEETAIVARIDGCILDHTQTYATNPGHYHYQKILYSNFAGGLSTAGAVDPPSPPLPPPPDGGGFGGGGFGT